MSAAITRDEWLSALGASVAPVDPDAKTLEEIAAEFRVSRHTAYRRMRQLVAEGRAVETTKMLTLKTGGARRVPAYRLVKPEGRKR